MYRTCLHCTHDLASNEALESLPIGRRVAFDAARGRLWVICPHCGKWNLVPFDNRLEIIDDCERLFRDTPTRFSTGNIGMARSREGLELVRIGSPQLPEFASWRYGEQYRRRRRIGFTVAAAGAIMPQVVLQIVLGQSAGLPAAIVGPGVMFGSMAIWQTLMSRASRIVTTVPGFEKPQVLESAAITSAHLSYLDGNLSLSWNPTLLGSLRKEVITMTGPGTRLLARRVLAKQNRAIGSQNEIETASKRVGSGEFEGYLTRVSERSTPYLTVPMKERLKAAGKMFLPPAFPNKADAFSHVGFAPGSFSMQGFGGSTRLAIEMWLSEEDEAKALAGELALLERQWQEADALAKITDALELSARSEGEAATPRELPGE